MWCVCVCCVLCVCVCVCVVCVCVCVCVLLSLKRSLALRVLECHLIRVWMQVSLMVQRGRGGKQVKLEGLLNIVPGPYSQSS